MFLFHKSPITEPPICGGRHESQMEGLEEVIQSKDIVEFSFGKAYLSCSAKKNEDGSIHISCNGGGQYNRRDGSLFSIVYDTKDDSIFKSLQEIIDQNNETKGNGHCTFVDGLPGGLGDRLDVTYASGEKLYKTSNQHPTVSPKASDDFGKVFHDFVKKDGYDFTTDGSNVQLFDDADEDYLQGTWNGKHFGDDISVTFEKDIVTISVNGKVVDDHIPYVIFQGNIRPKKLKDGLFEATSEYDYEPFQAMQSMSKKNWFTLSSYYRNPDNGASSSADLHNFDKKKPENVE